MRTRGAGWRVGGPTLSLLLLKTACGGVAAPPSPTSPDPSQATSSASPAGPAPPSANKPVDPRKGGFETGFGEFAVATEARAIRPGPVTFVVRNGGKLVHGFELESEDEGGGNSRGSGHGDRFKIETEEFGPGDVIRVQTNLPSGVYKIKCYVSNHEELGMRTFLTVKPDAPLVKPTAIAPDEIDIKGFAYTPSEVTVPAGTTVRWVNRDPAAHTVTADDSSFQSDVLDPDATFRVKLTEAGGITYHCAIHPTMKGTIVVT